MSQQENAYKKILSSTSLFGVVQFSNFFISAVRHKIFAVLIGPAGYGVLSIIFTGFDIIRQATGLGLDVTAVKKISEENGNDRNKAISVIIKLSVITGVLGMLVFTALSYKLSIWAYGHSGQSIAIILISGSLILRQVAVAQTAIMQGAGMLKYLAKTSLYGNFFGLFVTIPLFWFFDIDAILPTIFLSAAVSLLVSFYYFKKTGFSYNAISFKNALLQGKDMLYFGMLISINGLLPLVSNYVVQLYINYSSGKADVGFFNIGQTIINSYVSIIFTAMAMEYYPRLAAFNKDTSKEGTAVSQQAIFSTLLILPLIILFIELGPFIVRLLFSAEFAPALGMLSWLIMAMFFKAISFSIGYLIIARADSRVFLKTALISNVVYICLCVFGYHASGLVGLGKGFFIYYALHLIMVYTVTKVRYKLNIDRQLFKIITLSLLIFVPVVLTVLFAGAVTTHILLLVLFAISAIFSWYQLNRQVNIIAILRGLITKKK